MPVIVRLQNLPKVANSGDVRNFFGRLHIPEGGVHILGGERGDAFIVFLSDIDARIAMKLNGQRIHGASVKLSISSYDEMKYKIESVTGCEFVGILPPKHSTTKCTLSPQHDKYSLRKDDRFRHSEKMGGSSRTGRLSSPIQELEYYPKKMTLRQSISPEARKTKYFKSHPHHVEAHSSRRELQMPDSRCYSPRRSPSLRQKHRSSRSRSDSPRRHGWHKSRYPHSRSRSRSYSPRSRYHSHHSSYYSHSKSRSYRSRSGSRHSRSHSPHSASYSHHSSSRSSSWQRTYRTRRESVSSQSESLSSRRRSKSPYFRHHNSDKKNSSSYLDQESQENIDYTSRDKSRKYNSAYSKEMSGPLGVSASIEDDHFSFQLDATKQSSTSDSFSHASDFQLQGRSKKKYINIASEKQFSGNSSDSESQITKMDKMGVAQDPQALLEKRIREALSNGYDSRLKAEFNALHFSDHLVGEQNNVVGTETHMNNLHPEHFSLLSGNFHEISSPILGENAQDSTYFQSHSAPLPPVTLSFQGNVFNAYTEPSSEFVTPQNDVTFSEPSFQPEQLNVYNPYKRILDRKFVLLTGLSATCTLKDLHKMFKIHLPQNCMRWMLDNRGMKTGIAILALLKRDFYKIRTKKSCTYEGMNVKVKYCPPAVARAYFSDDPRVVPELQSHEDLCYQLRYIPFAVTQEDIAHFFEGIQIKEIYIVYRDNGYTSSTAFVSFSDVGSFLAAGQRSGSLCGNRKIKMFACTLKEMLDFKRRNGDLKLDMKSVHSKRTLCALLTGLPTNVTTSKVSAFFSRFGLRPDCIHITLNSQRQPNGRAFAEFTNISDFDAALKCHGNLLENNPICVKQILYDEMVKILDKQKAQHDFGEEKEPDSLPEKVPYLWDPTDEVVGEMTILPESQKTCSTVDELLFFPKIKNEPSVISLVNSAFQDKALTPRVRKSIQNRSNLISCKITENIESFDVDSSVISAPKKPLKDFPSTLPSEKETNCKIVGDINSKETNLYSTKADVKSLPHKTKSSEISPKECTAEVKTEIPGLTLVTDSTYNEQDDDVIIIEEDDEYDNTLNTISEKHSLPHDSKNVKKESTKPNLSKSSVPIPKQATVLKSCLKKTVKTTDSLSSTNAKKRPDRERFFRSQQRELRRTPMSDYKQECSLQLGNVPAFIDTDALVKFFNGFSILKEKCIRRFTESGNPTGDVRVTFSSLLEAERALDALNGHFLGGQQINMHVVN